ncbi:MAG: hypothetical protein JSS44_02100 [Proteobacteria bacterium]|nr:hypothetical protein [Pseudomonadota bacterium]
MRLIEEMQRRKVFKVGAAWLVIGWVLIQVAATVAPELKLPEWLPTMVTVLVGLGFPVALVLAWFFDITPDGVRRDPEDVAAAASHATTVVASTSASGSAAPAPAAPAATPIAAPRKSIAVLAFADLSPSHDQEYFSDGIAEEILNALVKLKDLKVAGRTSAFSFKGRNADLREIGRALGVAHVLEGSVRKHGQKVRITAQLIHAADGYHLWSESYDGELTDIFELQEHIARAITHELDVILHGDAAQRLVPVATRDPEAYALYLKASDIFARRDGRRFPDAIACLQQALRLDPAYARAHARLASIRAIEPVYVPDATDDAPEKVRQEALRASELDPKLAEPYAAMGLNDAQQHRFVDSRQAMDHALALDPNDITAVFWAASILINTGYTARGLAMLDRALEIDPLYPNALLWRGTQFAFVADLDRAEPMLRRAAEVGLAHAPLGMHLVAAARGQTDEAIAQLTEGLRVLGAGLPDGAPAILARGVYGAVRDRQPALDLIDRFFASQPRWMPSSIMYALFQMGDMTRVLALGRDFRTTNDAQYFHMIWSPAMRAARATPAFRDFTRAVGMTALWDRYGPPDGAHRTAAGEYVFGQNG